MIFRAPGVFLWLGPGLFPRAGARPRCARAFRAHLLGQLLVFNVGMVLLITIGLTLVAFR